MTVLRRLLSRSVSRRCISQSWNVYPATRSVAVAQMHLRTCNHRRYPQHLASMPVVTPSSICFSTSSEATVEPALDVDGPSGSLFEPSCPVGTDLINKSASIRRTFGPRANSEAMLICGGPHLAAHASFDPDYGRAQGWIRQHPVGPAILSPVLVTGLVGALVEATFPESVPMAQSLSQLRPLIVGVEVVANIRVTSVVDSRGMEATGERTYGYQVQLETRVARVRDKLVIAEGSHTIWIPDYLRM